MPRTVARRTSIFFRQTVTHVRVALQTYHELPRLLVLELGDAVGRDGVERSSWSTLQYIVTEEWWNVAPVMPIGRD
jgi:hypothetical protein